MKDKFIWDETYVSCDYVIDNQENKSIPVVDVVDLLNKQAQRIAELEEENKELKQCLIEMQMPRGTMKTVTKKVVMFDTLKKEYQKLQEENAKLKEQLKKRNRAKFD